MWTRTTRARPLDPAQLPRGSRRAARPRGRANPTGIPDPYFFPLFPEATSATRTRPIKLAIPSEPSARRGGAQRREGASQPRDPIRRFARPARTQAVFFIREKPPPREGSERTTASVHLLHVACCLLDAPKGQKGGEARLGRSQARARDPPRPHTASKRRRRRRLVLAPRLARKDLPGARAAMSCGGQAGGWLLDYGLVEEEIQGSEFIYMVDDPAVSR